MFLLFAWPLIYLPCFITHNYFESCFCVYQDLIPFVPEYYSIMWICYISISHWCTFGPFSVWAYQTCYEYPCTNLCIDPCFHLSQEIWSSMSGSQDRCFNLRNCKHSKVCGIFHSHSNVWMFLLLHILTNSRSRQIAFLIGMQSYLIVVFIFLIMLSIFLYVYLSSLYLFW